MNYLNIVFLYASKNSIRFLRKRGEYIWHKVICLVTKELKCFEFRNNLNRARNRNKHYPHSRLYSILSKIFSEDKPKIWSSRSSYNSSRISKHFREYLDLERDGIARDYNARWNINATKIYRVDGGRGKRWANKYKSCRIKVSFLDHNNKIT